MYFIYDIIFINCGEVTSGTCPVINSVPSLINADILNSIMQCTAKHIEAVLWYLWTRYFCHSTCRSLWILAQRPPDIETADTFIAKFLSALFFLSQWEMSDNWFYLDFGQETAGTNWKCPLIRVSDNCKFLCMYARNWDIWHETFDWKFDRGV